MAIKTDKRPLGEGAEAYIVKVYGPTIARDGVEDGGHPAVTVIVRKPIYDALEAADKTAVADLAIVSALDALSFAGE